MPCSTVCTIRIARNLAVVSDVSYDLYVHVCVVWCGVVCVIVCVCVCVWVWVWVWVRVCLCGCGCVDVGLHPQPNHPLAVVMEDVEGGSEASRANATACQADACQPAGRETVREASNTSSAVASASTSAAASDDGRPGQGTGVPPPPAMSPGAGVEGCCSQVGEADGGLEANKGGAGPSICAPTHADTHERAAAQSGGGGPGQQPMQPEGSEARKGRDAKRGKKARRTVVYEGRVDVKLVFRALS